jgi:hypothetical protein
VVSLAACSTPDTRPWSVTWDDGCPSSSTLLGWGEGGGELVKCEGLAAQGAGAEDEGEDDLQFSHHLVEGHPGAGAFGSVRMLVMKAWERTARVTWRCHPR